MDWTEEKNKETINALLGYYADLIGSYSDFVDQTIVSDLPTKVRCLQTLKSLASTIDFLMKRWSLIYRGYDGNAYQAALDVSEDVPKSETDGVSTDGNSETLDLKIVLREMPETKESARAFEGVSMGRERLGSESEVSDGSVSLRTPSEPATARPKRSRGSDVSAEILKVLEAGEQKTASLAKVVSRSERSVRRVLASLISEGKVDMVKKGLYRLSRSVLWTEDDNKQLINHLLALYRRTIDACKDDIEKMLVSDDDMSSSEKIRLVKSFNSCVAGMDRLMKRWSLVYLGYNTNTKKAKVDALMNAAQRDKVSLENAPLEELFRVVAHYHRDMREILENMPPPLKSPNDETGTWTYDAVTKELFPPWGSEPISEVEAKKRLMQRKTPGPAALILFG